MAHNPGINGDWITRCSDLKSSWAQVSLRPVRYAQAVMCFQVSRMKTIFKNHMFLGVSLIYSVPILIYTIVSFSSNLTFENNNLNNALTLGFFIVPFLVIYWFTFIRIRRLKLIVISVFSMILIPFYAISSLAIIFIANDVFTMNNNGFRAIHEIPIDDNRNIIVYRTPDKGALGGDFIDVALVKRLGFGLINRDFSKEIYFKDRYSEPGGIIIFEGKEYDVPALIEIESKGNLK